MPKTKYNLKNKWCAIAAKGKPVTASLASVIIVQTGGTYMCCNDKSWVKTICSLSGVDCDENGFADYDSLEAFAKRYDILDLAYLSNSRVMSNYVLGPNGWIDWSGHIGYEHPSNIGKWPSADEVLADAKLIAKRWPLLDMRFQVWDREHSEESDDPAAFSVLVRNGKASLRAPVKTIQMVKYNEQELEASVVARLTVSGAERGCSSGIYQKALETIRLQNKSTLVRFE